MIKNNKIIKDLVTINIEVIQAGKTQEWSGEYVSPGYALSLLKSAEVALRRDEPQGIVEDAQMECNACGHSVEPDDNYCSNCGELQEK